MARARAGGFDSSTACRLAGCLALLVLCASASAHAQSCKSDEDCASGEHCNLPPLGASTSDCVPDAGGCRTSAPERTGECKPDKLYCDSDEDCPAGLTCAHRADSEVCAVAPSVAGADAGLATDAGGCQPSEPSPGECTYQLVACNKDGDCKDGLVCTALSKTSECSESSAGPCPPGMTCPVPEPVCTDEVTHSYCFPARVDCTSNDDCDHGARCVELPADAQKDPPPGWQGAKALCLPEGIALALEGRAEIAGGESSQDSSSTNSTAARSAKDEQAQSTAKPVVEHQEASTGGCAVRAPARAGGSAFAACAFMLVLRRRRTRALR